MYQTQIGITGQENKWVNWYPQTHWKLDNGPTKNDHPLATDPTRLDMQQFVKITYRKNMRSKSMHQVRKKKENPQPISVSRSTVTV
jgi:hypothetical protein